MKKISILMMLFVQCLLVSAQQVVIDHSRGVAYIPAGSSFNVADAGVEIKKAPQRALASTERGVGYCQGDSITHKGIRIGKAGSYDMGAMLTQQTMANYKGCKIVGVRFAVSESIGKSNIFIYKVNAQGNAEKIVSNTVRRTSEGWNDVRLNSSQEIEITGDSHYIMGFTYNESDDMVAGSKGALCSYGNKVSSSYSCLILQNKTFNSITNIGDLCVQLIVDVSSLPKKVVNLNSILNGTSYKKIGSDMDIMMSYTNAGLETINSVRFGFRIDNGEPVYKDVEFTGSEYPDGFAPGKSTTLQLDFNIPTTTPVGRHVLNISVDQIDGEIPHENSRGTLTDPFVAYNNSYPRQQIYVEQYNSQNSYLASIGNEYYSQVDKDDDACVVNIYQSGEPLAVEASTYLNDLYAYTLPCFTLNRFFFAMGEWHYAYDFNDYLTIFPGFVYDGIKDLVTGECQSIPSFAKVWLKTSFDNETREVSVDVSGDVADEAPAIFGDMAVTVMLAEDNVVGKQVVYNSTLGNTSTNNKYLHNQVLRAYLTKPVGDKITIDGNKFTAHYTYTLPADWKSNDLKVVAFVTKAFDQVTADNMQQADVTNCNSVKLGGTTAIDGVVSDNAFTAADGTYTIDGVKVNENTALKGMYIIRHNGKSFKVMK